MPLNTNIYAQFAPQPKSTQDYLDEYDARDMRDQQNKLNALGLQEKQRGIEDNNKLRNLYAQPGFDPNTDAGIAAVGRIAPAQATALQKSRLDTQDARSKINKQDVDALDTSLRQFRSFVPMVQSPDQVAGYVTALYNDPKLGPLVQRFGSLESLVASNQKLFTENPKQWQVSASGMTGDKLVETLKGTRQNLNLGDVYQGSTVDYFGGVMPSSVTKSAIGQSADNKASVGASFANAAATREAAQTQANATREAATIQTGFQNESGLRKEFEGLTEIKNYKQAYPAFAAVKDAASRNTPQSDINIVYGIAKLYDPTSVVREGEYATVANSPNIPEKIKGYAQYLAGGGRLSPKTKADLVQEATGRLGTYEAEAQKARSSYDAIARRRGIDPANVFQGMGDMGNTPGLPDMSAVDAEIERRKKGGK